MAQCRGTTKRGERCRRDTVTDAFCSIHAPELNAPPSEPERPAAAPPAELPTGEEGGTNVCGQELDDAGHLCDLRAGHPGLCCYGYGPDYPVERIPRAADDGG